MTTERPVQVKVVKVKKSDKGDFYKRQIAWALRDLAVVDAKDAIKVSFPQSFACVQEESFLFHRAVCVLRWSKLVLWLQVCPLLV